MLSSKTIDTRASDFLIKTKKFCLNEFENEPFIAILYGSYAKKIAHAKSDLDIMIVTDRVCSKRINRITKFIYQLHHEYQMALDFEIPYEQKVCISRSFLERSCSGESIFKQSKWLLNKIIPSQPFEITTDLLQRFIIGMMTNQHLFAGGDYSLYTKYKNLAFINILQAIFSIANEQVINVHDLIECMYSLNNVSERDLIGFEYNDSSRAYLTETLIKIIYTNPQIFKFINNDLDVKYLGHNFPLTIDYLNNKELNQTKDNKQSYGYIWFA